MATRRPRDGDDERDGPDPSNPSVYEGERDAEGRPHGRGRMRLDDEGVWHEGRFVRGARHGRGTLRFPPDEYEPGRRVLVDSEGSTRGFDASRIPRRLDDYDFPVGGDRLAGTFVEGVLHGPAVYHSADGSSRKGTYVRGELTGSVEEFDASGALVFRGDYSDGRRHGDGVLRQPDGSVVVSYWHEGTQGCEGIFIYPRAYGVPVDASLKDKVPTKCRGYGRDAAAAAAAKLAKLANLANLANLADGTSAARNARPSFLFGAFAPPRAARDALAGEAAFFARHDAFGVVRAGSCWARFDEFEGSSSDASGKKNSEGYVSYRRDDFGIDRNDRNGDDVFLREWLRREPRAWREPFETPDHPTIPKLEARGVFSAASPEPLDRSQLELVHETRDGEAIGDFSRPAVRARARLAPNEIVGFIDPGDRRVVAPRGGCLPGSAPTSRWSPHDRIFYARELLPGEAEGAGGAAGGGADAERDDADLRSDDERGSSSSPSSSSSADSDSDSDSDSVVRDATDDDGRAIPRGGVFFSLSSESETRFRARGASPGRESARTFFETKNAFETSTSPLKPRRSLGGFARTATTGVPSTRRAPFAHPALGVAFALVAAEPVPAGAAPTQPPDYACGWALHPASEAGYYHHLRVSPPATVRETPGTANLGAVRVTQHGPWRALWLDGVEQGLAYDARFQRPSRLETDGDLRPSRPSRPFAHDPRVVGFEYVRAMATAAVASMGAKFMGAEGPPRFHSSSRGKTDPITETETDRASAKFGRERDDATTLCVGLGAGSLPAFLANAFVGAKKNKTCAPGAFRVECVEIDRAVAAAAREVLGVAYVPARGGLSAEEEDRGDSDDDAANERDDSTNSTNRRAVPFALRVDDAARYLAHLANTSEDEEKRKRFALICLDAYDGKGEIPSHLKTRAFLRDARLCLAPGGAVVANCFDAPPGSRARENLLAFCEALGGTVAGACAVRVRLLKVEGQESNVVVVAEATEREKKKKGQGAFGSRAALRAALAAAFAFLPAEARAALCDVDRLEVSGELTSKYDTPEAGEDVDG